MSGSAARAATDASPALATFTNGCPSASRPSSSGRVSVPVAASTAASSRSSGRPCTRAKSLAVPAAITASGTSRRPASSATGPIVPSPPATAIRSGSHAAHRARPVSSQSNTLDVRAVRAHRGHERLRVEPAAGARGWRRGRCARALRVHSPSCSAASTTSAWRSSTSTPRSPSIATRTACRSCTARRSRSRAWRPRCSTSARATSSCWRRSPATRRSAASSPSAGPGLHHVAYRVDDIAAVLDDLRAAGLRLIDEAPRAGIRGSQVAFLHPSASGGVLTELVQPAAVHA